MHQDQRRLRELLRGKVFIAVSRRERAPCLTRFWLGASPRTVLASARMEAASDDFCELDERSFSQGDSEAPCLCRIRHDGESGLAPLSGADQAQFAYAEVHQ